MLQLLSHRNRSDEQQHCPGFVFESLLSVDFGVDFEGGGDGGLEILEGWREDFCAVHYMGIVLSAKLRFMLRSPSIDRKMAR